MVFSGIIFLFIFLPVAIGAYYLCPNRFRNYVLVVASLIFYAWGEPKYILIMIFSSVFDFVNGLLLERFTERKIASRVVLITSVVGNLAILGTFKYAGGLLGLALPIGISFYTFQTMSYTIDVYRQKVQAQHNFISFAAYVTMFPQLIAGPIVRYKTVAEQLSKRTHSIDKFAAGVRRFILGLGKKVILANLVGQLWEYALNSSAGETTVVLSWLGAIAFTFQIYFDFSGYSDMAIGLGKMFGFDYDENFNYPYTERSITGFWRNWHISLGTWFKEYVYIPLGGNQKGIARQLVNIMIVWTLTGVWHGAAFNFMAWGVYYGILLVIEKLFLGKLLEKIPKVFGHFYMLFAVVVGWVLFAIEDFNGVGRYLSQMFGNADFVNGEAVYEFTKYAGVLLLCILFSTRLVKNLTKFLSQKIPPLLRVIYTNVAIFAIFALSIGLIVGDSYNPFLYFRF